MPLALYTIKDSEISSIFVIFICSIWPMLLNTIFGVASVRKDWLNVAKTLEVKPLRTAWRVILPAAAPTILTGMRISIGIAWLVIVAAEMLVGGTGIGYFVYLRNFLYRRCWHGLGYDPRPSRSPCGLCGVMVMSDAKKIIKVEGLERRFPSTEGKGDTQIFGDVWFDVFEGEFVCLIGHSGCGKTTFLNILAGRSGARKSAVPIASSSSNSCI